MLPFQVTGEQECVPVNEGVPQQRCSIVKDLEKDTLVNTGYLSVCAWRKEILCKMGYQEDSYLYICLHF